MNTLQEMFVKTGFILVILETIHSAAEKRSNKTCMGYHSSTEKSVYDALVKNERNLSEVDGGSGSSESSPILDPDVSTTQNYENSKLLFNYIVPANTESYNIKENEEEKEEEEEEEEEEVEKGEEREREDMREDENSDIEEYEEAEDDREDNEMTEDEEEEEENEEEVEEGEEREEQEEEKEENVEPEDKEENQYEEEAEEEGNGQTEEEERTDRETTSSPVMPKRQNYPPLMTEIRPGLDFTTLQPYLDPKPVSYSSVVYDPQGNTKTELSGSFYQKPLKLIPRSKLFRKESENVSEDTKTIQVTMSPLAEERSIQAPINEEDADDFESLRQNYEQRRIKILKVPSFKWSLPKMAEDDEAKKYNEKTRQQYHDKSNREKYYEQTINTRFGAKEKGVSEGDEDYVSEVHDLMKPETEWKHETVKKEILSEEDEADSGENYKPENKDRNQLYEYIVENIPAAQRMPQNNEMQQQYAATTPKKDEISTVLPPEDKTIETKTVKPSFATIIKSDSALTINNPPNNDVLFSQIVSDIQSMFTPPTPKPTNYEQHFLPSYGNCRTSLPNHDSARYETFIQSSHLQQQEDEEEVDEEEEEKEPPMPKRIPMKTYAVMKNLVKRPSAVKVTVYPLKSRPHMIYREAKPVSFRNSVYSGPIPSSNKLIRKVFYYEPKQKVIHYSPTNQILRIVRPQTTNFRSLPSSRLVIIRKS